MWRIKPKISQQITLQLSLLVFIVYTYTRNLGIADRSVIALHVGI